MGEEEAAESKVHFMEVQSGDASEVVAHTSRVQIRYALHIVDGAKVGRKIDSNKDVSGSKLLNVDLTAKKATIMSVSLY